MGRFEGCEDGIAYFAHDLEESVAFGDARYGDVCGLIRKTCIEKGMDVPDMPPPPPFTSSAPTSLDVRRFGAVIFTTAPAFAQATSSIRGQVSDPAGAALTGVTVTVTVAAFDTAPSLSCTV